MLEAMEVHIRVVVHPPSPIGGRPVTVDVETLGLAYSRKDLVEFLRRGGLELEERGLPASPVIEWRGGGPDTWEAP